MFPFNTSLPSGPASFNPRASGDVGGIPQSSTTAWSAPITEVVDADFEANPTINLNVSMQPFKTHPTWIANLPTGAMTMVARKDLRDATQQLIGGTKFARHGGNATIVVSLQAFNYMCIEKQIEFGGNPKTTLDYMANNFDVLGNHLGRTSLMSTPTTLTPRLSAISVQGPEFVYNYWGPDLARKPYAWLVLGYVPISSVGRIVSGEGGGDSVTITRGPTSPKMGPNVEIGNEYVVQIVAVCSNRMTGPIEEDFDPCCVSFAEPHIDYQVGFCGNPVMSSSKRADATRNTTIEAGCEQVEMMMMVGSICV